jgi:hypothetical protein
MWRLLVIIAEWYNSIVAMRAMRSFFANKFGIILLSLLALVALLALAAGMSGMTFRDAQVFGSNEPDSAQGNPADFVRTVLSVPLQTQAMFWVLVVLLFALIAMLLTPEGRKRLLRMMFRAFVTYWVIYFLLARYPQILGRLSAAFTPSNAAAPAEVVERVLPPAFTPPAPSSSLTYVISLVVAGLAAFLIWRLYAAWRVVHASSREQPVHRLARIARASLYELTAGRDSTDVILNCYFRMSDVVAEKRNLNRGISMTPQEFAARLERAGLPGEAVKQLTRLFEAVRYGGQRSSPGMVREAVACLTSILHYCGETV